MKLKGNVSGKKKARVLDARYDTCSRNVYRYEDLKDAVKMSRVKDHFICKYCIQAPCCEMHYKITFLII
jgi:hypothetical protein